MKRLLYVLCLSLICGPVSAMKRKYDGSKKPHTGNWNLTSPGHLLKIESMCTKNGDFVQSVLQRYKHELNDKQEAIGPEVLRKCFVYRCNNLYRLLIKFGVSSEDSEQTSDSEKVQDPLAVMLGGGREASEIDVQKIKHNFLFCLPANPELLPDVLEILEKNNDWPSLWQRVDYTMEDVGDIKNFKTIYPAIRKILPWLFAASQIVDAKLLIDKKKFNFNTDLWKIVQEVAIDDLGDLLGETSGECLLKEDLGWMLISKKEKYDSGLMKNFEPLKHLGDGIERLLKKNFFYWSGNRRDFIRKAMILCTLIKHYKDSAITEKTIHKTKNIFETLEKIQKQLNVFHEKWEKFMLETKEFDVSPERKKKKHFNMYN